jgi:putative ABC transport system permease protein
MLKLALRNVFRHVGRTSLTMAAIIAGVVGLIVSGGFVHDIFVQLGESVIHSQSGHIQVSREGFRQGGAREPERYRIAHPQPIEKTIAATPGVRDVMARITFARLLNNGRTHLALNGEGLEPDKQAALGTHLAMVAGRRLRASDEHGVMVGDGVARALKLEPGDRVTLMLSSEGGAVNTADLDVVGVFRTFSKDYDARAIRVPLAAAQDALGTPGISTIVVSLERTEDTDRIAGELEAKLAGQHLDVATWQTLNDFYAKTVKLYERQFDVLRAIILLMVLLSVANSVNMSLFERIPEFGTMRALGDRSGFIVRLVLVECLVLGVAGSAIGAILGVLVSAGISFVGIPMPPPPNSDVGYVARIEIVPVLVLAAFAIGVVATALAGIPAARRAVRIPVVDALRQAI